MKRALILAMLLSAFASGHRGQTGGGDTGQNTAETLSESLVLRLPDEQVQLFFSVAPEVSESD